MQDAKVWYLKQIDLFHDLDGKDLEKVSQCFIHTKYQKGHEIIELSAKKDIYLLKRGWVELSATSEDGRKIIIDLLGPGSLFGGMMSDDFDFSAKVKKDCMLCRISMDEFFKLVSNYPMIAEKLLRSLYRTSSQQKEWITILSTAPVLDRLVYLLKRFAQKPGFHIELMFTHEELAQMIGASRQTVTTLLNMLEKEGRVSKKGKHYILVDLMV